MISYISCFHITFRYPLGWQAIKPTGVTHESSQGVEICSEVPRWGPDLRAIEDSRRGPGCARLHGSYAPWRLLQMPWRMSEAIDVPILPWWSTNSMWWFVFFQVWMARNWVQRCPLWHVYRLSRQGRGLVTAWINNSMTHVLSIAQWFLNMFWWSLMCWYRGWQKPLLLPKEGQSEFSVYDSI